MSIPEELFPALIADAATNPDSARLLALLTKTEEALEEHPLPELVLTEGI
jgi:hypothetical protein